MKLFKGLFLAALLALFCNVATAQPVVLQSTLPSSMAAVSNATVIATTATPIALRGGVRGITLWQIANTTSGSGPSNSTISFNVSFDGTNYTTTYPYTTSVTLNGTTNVCSTTYIASTNLTGVLYIRPEKVVTTQIAPETNSVFVTFDP